ncbi:alkaline phosphatase family protein [Caulobacter endophyticus]|uniref:alkaline phosphatase family protein n=1 Tax=Caulobacter endophyticus TaxID=2172652 RepID=UPI00240EF15E|nr:alkaline phosphatase family protein [Caulobacter endophyticus]MDG2531702.1 alkaline phosphatase family protein [Caulobacter endophyticus]
MSTPQTAQILVKNATDGPAIVTLWHNNSDYGTESQTWTAPPQGTVGPMTVHFNTGLGSLTVQDYWGVKLAVQSGPSAGVYMSSGPFSSWKECQLRSDDAGQTITLTVTTTSLDIALPSGGCQGSMVRTGPYTAVDHVFVLMLENHSFDNIFAFSGIDGLQVATTADFNKINDQTYPVASPAPIAMPTDPGHEFFDVLEQLCGSGNAQRQTLWVPYNQPILNSGFASNYSTSTSEKPVFGQDLPTAGQIGDIMLGFDTPNQLPVIHALATNFAVCDAWHSSLPGPTWPNRFFVHGASSGGWTDSPSGPQSAEWTKGLGFEYPSGASIFDRLSDAKLNWVVYADQEGPPFGGTPQVSAIKRVYVTDIKPFTSFATDLQGPYPYAYTFIEPNYGDIIFNTYAGGSSQHPMDSMTRGEALIKATYEAIRNSPVWDRSLLIVTYDEHGGFYDSVAPGAAPPPNDGAKQDSSINKGGFLFDWYGVRVPAVVVSPLVAKGTVDHTPYDHASVPATLEALFGLPYLTQRDKGANTVLSLLKEATPRTDCPTVLPQPVSAPAPPQAAPASPDDPLPQNGNAQGLLQSLAKIDLDLQGDTPAAAAAVQARVAAITTRGELQAYAQDVTARAQQARAAQLAAQQAAQPGVPS